MPTNKDFKSLVRARMQKTGGARAKLAGMSDAAIKKATGCTWDRWAFALDHYGAEDLSHRAIAEHVQNTYKVSDWWAQTVTVGYERIKGLRAIGQRRHGGYEATKSKTVNAPASAVFRAFAHARVRKAWLPEKVMVRKATPNRSVRDDVGGRLVGGSVRDPESPRPGRLEPIPVRVMRAPARP